MIKMITVKWFGHAAFSVKINGKTFYIDPWIRNPASKITEIPLEAPDYIIVTHDHGDHLGDTIDIMKKHEKSKLISVYEIAAYVADQLKVQGRTIGANIGGPIDLGDGFKVILTPAYHSSGKGAPTGVVFGRDELYVYHAGDTGLTYDMKLIGELYKPILALIPIGGHYTMGPLEAAYATKLINPKYVIPMHYQTFPVIKGSPEEFKKYLKELEVKVEVIVLKPGEETTIKI
ncbi:MAG: metal-dependent hydrolase [Candidatus Methanomethylicia archaeon]